MASKTFARLLALICILIPPLMVVQLVLQYPRNIPVWDQYRSVPVALAAHDGTLTLTDIFSPSWGHFTVFTHLTTALATITTGWNLNVEVYVGFALALVNFTLLLRIARDTLPDVPPLLLAVVLSVLVFYLRQNLNWIVGYNNAWQFANLFLLLTVWVLLVTDAGWSGVLLALLSATASAFSVGAGLFTFTTGLLLILFTARWRWIKAIVWLIGAGAVLSVYAVSGALASDAETAPVTLPLLAGAVKFMLLSVGLVFDPFATEDTALVVAGVAFSVLLVNAFYLSRYARNNHAVAVWLSLAAYTVGVLFLAGVARLTLYGMPQGYSVAFWSTWYTTPAIALWSAVLLTGTAVLDHMRRTRRRLLYALLNVVVLIIVVAGYAPATRYAYNQFFSQLYRSQTGQCGWRYIFVQAPLPECPLEPDDYTEKQFNQLAARQLAIYAQITPVNIIGAAAPTVIVQSESAWFNSHTRDFLLAGVPTQNTIHLFPADDPALTRIPVPPEPAPALPVLEMESVWVISPVSHPRPVVNELEAQGYMPVTVKTYEGVVLIEQFHRVQTDKN